VVPLLAHFICLLFFAGLKLRSANIMLCQVFNTNYFNQINNLKYTKIRVSCKTTHSYLPLFDLGIDVNHNLIIGIRLSSHLSLKFFNLQQQHHILVCTNFLTKLKPILHQSPMLLVGCRRSIRLAKKCHSSNSKRSLLRTRLNLV